MTIPSPGRAPRALATLARTFGSGAARAKAALLERIAGAARLPAGELAGLQETLLFLLAYPDDRAVLQGARRCAARLRAWTTAAMTSGAARSLRDTGLPASVTVDTWGFPLLIRLRRLHPGDLEVEWDEVADLGPLQAAVVRILHGAEVPGLDDISLEWDDWLAALRVDASQRDLDLLLDLFARAELTPTERESRFDGCGLAVAWQHAGAGSGRAELLWPGAGSHFQARPPPRGHAPLARAVRRPLAGTARLAPARGERFLDFAAAALAARQSEIRPLSYGNPRDVTLADCGRGLVIGLIGVVPEYREALESLYTVLLLRNGVPIAYGPASVAAGCCELGLNLFDEFRGVETRHLYAQYLRVVHRVLGARTFFVTAYGMGAGNPDALRAGSFWFYRRLGFLPANPAVETLARNEEARLRATPGARSDLRTLRRLSDTSVSLDLSGGICRPLALGGIGLAVTRRMTRVHGGEREAAARRDARRVRQALDLDGVPRATVELLAPVLCLDPELERRSAAERGRLARFVAAKAAPAERGADRLLQRCPGFLDALRRAAAQDPAAHADR